jgi:hypothetical protein
MCQALDGKFLQINSDGFRLAPWTLGGIGRMITLTCGICYLLLGESGKAQ